MATVLAELEMAPALRARDLEREERESAVSIFYHTLISRTRLINDFVIAASRLVSGYSFLFSGNSGS